MRLYKSILLLIILSLFLSACQLQWQDIKSSVWWKDAVFYEAFVRSFADSNGDGIGDFKGMTAKLDYLNTGKPGDSAGLGINGIWLMPVFPSPSYHGYDVTDYYTVNPQYGTLDEFKALVKAAHQRGIRVIIDFVLNHTSNQHPWFIASAAGDPKYKDWYIWSDTNPGYSGPWGETVWHPLNGRYYYGIFTAEMPDLNYRNPAVTAEIEKIASFWLKDVGIDGFRLDGAKHLIEDGQQQENSPETHAWLKQFHDYVKSIKPDALVVGEVLSPTSQVSTYVNNGELDLAFSFDLATAILNGVSNANSKVISSSLADQAAAFTGGEYAPILSNHDFARSMTKLGNKVPLAKAAATILLSTPGVPFLYYGEEIGILGNKPDPLIRTPMQWDDSANAGFTTGQPWEMVVSDYKTKNVKAENSNPQSLLNHYRTIIRIRADHYALRTGLPVQVKTGDYNLFASLLVADKEAILVIVNLSSDPIKAPHLNWARSPLKGSYQPAVLLGQGQVAVLSVGEDGSIENYQPLPEVPAYGQIIVQLKPRITQ